MNRRQTKKLILQAKKNMVPYRQAMTGGSKKLDRRRKALFRHSSDGGVTYDRMSRVRKKLGHSSHLTKSAFDEADVERAYDHLNSAIKDLGDIMLSVAEDIC